MADNDGWVLRGSGLCERRKVDRLNWKRDFIPAISHALDRQFIVSQGCPTADRINGHAYDFSFNTELWRKFANRLPSDLKQ